MRRKNKRYNSSIRKKIVHGYMGIFSFISFMLFLIVIAALYTASFYIGQEYIRSNVYSTLEKIVEYETTGMDSEDLYIQAEKMMPDFVSRYDVVIQTKKIKEEDYYNISYFHNQAKESKDVKNIVTPTPLPSVLEGEMGNAVYSQDDLVIGYATATVVNIRLAPSIQASVYDAIEYGSEIYIAEDLGGWYKIIYDDTELYVNSKFIDIGQRPTPTPEYYQEFWEYESEHLFSKSGAEYTTEGSFNNDQVGNALLSLGEPLKFYIITGTSIYEENDKLGYVIEDYYRIKAVVDITDIIPLEVIWLSIGLVVALLIVLYLAGLLLIWIYGAAKTRKYLKTIDEITRLTNEIQPNSQYRLNVNTAKYELKELVITINNMLDRLNDAHVKRKKFVSDVSHELRTPISVVAGYANMLKRWAKDDQAVFDESVNAIIEESSNMKYLVENLLFLARSDNNQNVYEMETFDISNLIQSICRDAKMVDNGKHDVYCEIAQGVIVSGDRNRLKQAFREFMQNAIKYTPPTGEIKVSLQKVGEKAIINVKDTGMGISKKDLEHIFTRFYRGDVSRNRDNGGYGLGLAICKEIISSHKGKISFKSKEDAGTEVTVVLDLA